TADEEPGSVVRLFAEDLQRIEGAPYHMDCFEVNAVNYGAPQLRERALFIGNRFHAVVPFPDPTHGAPNGKRNESTLADLWEDAPTAAEPWMTLGQAICGLDDADSVLMDFSPRKKSFLAMVPPGSNWRSLPIEIQ